MLNFKCQFWYLPQRASLACIGSHIAVYWRWHAISTIIVYPTVFCWRLLYISFEVHCFDRVKSYSLLLHSSINRKRDSSSGVAKKLLSRSADCPSSDEQSTQVCMLVLPTEIWIIVKITCRYNELLISEVSSHRCDPQSQYVLLLHKYKGDPRTPIVAYSAPCNGVVSHGAPIVVSLMQTKCNYNLCAPCCVSHMFIFKLRPHYICFWQVTVILIVGKTWIPPIVALCLDKDGAGSGISGLYLWLVH